MISLSTSAMAEWRTSGPSWTDDWRRNWSGMLSVPSAVAASLGLPAPGMLPGDPFGTVVDAARALLVGKPRAFRVAGCEVTLTLTDIAVEGPDIARAVGQYGQVRICARDVRWDGGRLGRLEVLARNVHLRPGSRPALVAAPLLVEAFVPAPVASRWLAAASPRLELAVRDGVPQLGLARAPWARLEVEAGAEGRCILIRPRALHLRGRRLPVRSPAFRLAWTGLPRGLLLTAAEPAAHGFVVRGTLSEWQRSLSRADIERLLTGMRRGSDRLDL
jgi:hypothetical protein